MLKQIVLLLTVPLLLTACAPKPETLGFSTLQWQSFSEAKQQNLRENYNTVKAENKNLESDWITEPNNRISVKLKRGTVMVPPEFTQSSYQPLSFTLNKNQCKEVPIQSGNGKVDLRACYYKNYLFIDPSRYNVKERLGTVRIPTSPLWNRGFTYRKIKSEGYVRLANADITIKYMANNENTPVTGR